METQTEENKIETIEETKITPVDTTNKKPGMNIGLAIIIAGLIIGGAIFVSQGKPTSNKQKTIIQNLNISETKFKACFEEKRYENKIRENMKSAERATAHIPADQGRGTPYSIILAKNGTKAEIAGAYPIEAVKGILDSVLSGTTKNQAEITIDPITLEDHYFGSKDAEIVIIEYSDLECPYCSRFHQTMHQVIKDYNGKVAWVYRHLPLESIHPNSFNKALASECVAEIGGDAKFWLYIDTIFDKAAPKTPKFDPTTGETITE